MAPDAFDGVRRYYDPTFRATAVKILPGECYVTADPAEMLVTVLGSCVAACLFDPAEGVGGMNHFMLPSSVDGYWGETAAAMRYGNFAMERLIGDVLAAGARREQLQVKVFGGAAFTSSHSVGPQNAAFVERYLRDAGLPIAAQLLRPPHPLRVHFVPASGRAFVLPIEDGAEIVERSETRYREAIVRDPPAALAAPLHGNPR
jgi:chemotaxis protein CheD